MALGLPALSLPCDQVLSSGKRTVFLDFDVRAPPYPRASDEKAGVYWLLATYRVIRPVMALIE